MAGPAVRSMNDIVSDDEDRRPTPPNVDAELASAIALRLEAEAEVASAIASSLEAETEVASAVVLCSNKKAELARVVELRSTVDANSLAVLLQSIETLTQSENALEEAKKCLLAENENAEDVTSQLEETTRMKQRIEAERYRLMQRIK